MTDPLVPEKTLFTQINTIHVLAARLLAQVDKYNLLKRKKRLECIHNASIRLGKTRK